MFSCNSATWIYTSLLLLLIKRNCPSLYFGEHIFVFLWDWIDPRSKWISLGWVVMFLTYMYTLIDWLIDWLMFWCFNATFSNISAILWRTVLVEEEAGVPVENHRPTGKLYHLRIRVECTLFCNLQHWARTHAVLVIGLYELLDPSA